MIREGASANDDGASCNVRSWHKADIGDLPWCTLLCDLGNSPNPENLGKPLQRCLTRRTWSRSLPGHNALRADNEYRDYRKRVAMPIPWR